MEDAIIPVVLFLTIGFVTLGFMYYGHKNRLALMQTVQKAVKQGNTLTPELLTRLGGSINPVMRDLRRGIILLSTSSAALLCSLFFSDPFIVGGIRAGAMFPLMIGLGFLLVWKLNKGQE